MMNGYQQASSIPTTGTAKVGFVHGVYLDPEGDMVHHHIQRTRKPFEPESMAFWEASLRSDRLALDVGAYTGLYAIRAAILGFRSWAFEPHPKIYARLLENAQRNLVKDQISVHNVACGADTGVSRMKGHPDRLSSAGSLVGASKRGIEVPVAKLDRYPLEAPVSVIKIDVEGYEIPVLAGASRILHRDRPNLILEANTKAEEEDIRRFLPSYNFWRADERNLLGEPC